MLLLLLLLRNRREGIEGQVERVRLLPGVRLVERPGVLHFFVSFADLPVDEAANRTLCEFFEDKIRASGKDPETADALVPDHLIMTKRLCGENGY